jgi:NADH:quinone reductase (non-electrogenic)
VREQTFRTALTDLLQIRHPIIAGGLMWLADAKYVAAVVNAGAFGFITARSFAPDDFARELETAWKLTGGTPFGVNFHVSVRSESNQDLPRLLEIALAAGVRHFETSGNPPLGFLEAIKAGGGVILHKVSEIRHAESAIRRLPVDAIAIVGGECGGHPGLNLIGTIVQAPLASTRISKPVVIGGGIGTGTQIAACLAMGADGVLLGTRLLVSEEIWSDRAIKQRVVDSQETDTRLILASMRNTYRGMDNATTRAVAELESAGVTDFEQYRPYVMGSLQRDAYETGDPEKGILSMGQACVFADRIEPVEAIIDRLIDEAVEGVERLHALSCEPLVPRPA